MRKINGYNKAELERALKSLLPPEKKIDLRTLFPKLVVDEGNPNGWVVPFSGEEVLLIVWEEDMLIDLPSYYDAGGINGLILSDAVFYFRSENADPRIYDLIYVMNRPVRLLSQDPYLYLQKYRIWKNVAEGVFIPVVAHFEFLPILKERLYFVDDTVAHTMIYYPDHLKDEAEPKLGLTYANITSAYSI